MKSLKGSRLGDRKNHLGGTSLVTDEDGMVMQLYDYYPYGSELLNNQLSDTKVHHSFTDKELDDDLGLYYFEARWYDSEIGRFISSDPLDGMSYTYAANNPLIVIDPTGLYDVETGEIEEGDTTDSIVATVNEAYGIETDWETIAEVSFFDAETSIEDLIGQFTNVGTNYVKDVSSSLDALNEYAAEEFVENGYGLLTFMNYFKEGGAGDLKNWKDNSIFGGRDGNRKYFSYIYHGKLIRYDAPGNIHLGYVADAIDMSLSTVLFGANTFNFATGLKLDDPYDQRMTVHGYYESWYSNPQMWSNW